MDRSVDAARNKRDVLHKGALIGAWGLIVTVGLGGAANLRESGLGVAPALASSPLHLRYSIALFYGCVALLLSVMWSRLASDAPMLTELRSHVSRALVLCALGPLLVPVVNYLIVTGLTPRHLALLPALVAPAVAGLYALTTHRLSGTTGVGLATRQVLRGSYVWLLIGTGLQLVWVAARVFGARQDMLWFIERPVLEVTMLGFAISAALGVLLTSLNAMYHSREMTQAVVRGHYVANGLVLLWGLSLMWSMRFPGSYQGLASAVIGIALMIVLVILAGSSGLLSRQKLPWLGAPDPGDGVWAGALASTIMLLVTVTGLLIAICATMLPAFGKQPPESLLAAQAMAVGLGVVPLAVASAVAAWRRGLSGWAAVGSVLIAVGALVGVVLWGLSGPIERFAQTAAVAEATVAVGWLLVAVVVQGVSEPDQ